MDLDRKATPEGVKYRDVFHHSKSLRDHLAPGEKCGLAADLHAISTEPVERDFTKQVWKQAHQQGAPTMSMIDNRSFHDIDTFFSA